MEAVYVLDLYNTIVKSSNLVFPTSFIPLVLETVISLYCIGPVFFELFLL